MSDVLDILLNPRRWFPIKRRVHSSYSESFHVTQTRTSAQVMEWCKIQFGGDEEKALKHYLRIERRLHRLPAMLSGPFHLTDVRWNDRRHMPGDFLFPSLFR